MGLGDLETAFATTQVPGPPAVPGPPRSRTIAGTGTGAGAGIPPAPSVPSGGLVAVVIGVIATSVTMGYDHMGGSTYYIMVVIFMLFFLLGG